MARAYRLILLTFLGAATAAQAQLPPPPYSYGLTAPSHIDPQGGCASLRELCVETGNLPPLSMVHNSLPSSVRAEMDRIGMGSGVLSTMTRGIGDLSQSFFMHGPRGFGRGAEAGFYVSGRDGGESPYTRIKVHYQFERAPAVTLNGPGWLIPWATGRQTEIEFRFQLSIGTISAGPSSAAYGHPTMEFRDVGSGLSLLVTLQTYGTTPPMDFVAPHAQSGTPIVSTSFRPDPLFGRVVASVPDGNRYLDCATESCAGIYAYKFRIGRADFAKILELARGIEPRLSADPSHYFLDNAQFNHEIYGDGELGVTLPSAAIQLFDY